MTSRDRGGDNSSRATQRGNNGNQEARDMHETGRHDEDDGQEAGATGRGQQGRGKDGTRAKSVNSGDRGVGNNTDGILGSGGDEGLGTRDNA